jgi:hypothetical protein
VFWREERDEFDPSTPLFTVLVSVPYFSIWTIKNVLLGGELAGGGCGLRRETEAGPPRHQLLSVNNGCIQLDR